VPPDHPGDVTEGSRVLLYLVVGGSALVALLVFLSVGPLGWLAVGVLAAAGLLVQTVRADPEEESPDRTACPDCGAPNDPDSARCVHCDTPL
jgi:hypothetical protein